MIVGKHVSAVTLWTKSVHTTDEKNHPSCIISRVTEKQVVHCGLLPKRHNKDGEPHSQLNI